MKACPKNRPVTGYGLRVTKETKVSSPSTSNHSPVTSNPARAGIGLSGKYTDVAHYPDGSSRVLQQGHNLILDGGLGMVAGALGGLSPPIWGWAMGSGSPNWDVEAPTVTPDLAALTTPVLTKAARFSFWNLEENRFSLTPTDTLDVRVVLLAEEGNGTLREFALVGPPPEHPLFNAVIHPPIEKTAEFNLERIMRISFGRAE